MDDQDDLLRVQQHWQQGRTVAQQTASEAELARFATVHQIQLPADLVRYFALVNGTGGAYDEPFFCFYALEEVQTVAERFHDYHGTPKYSDLLRTWPEHGQFYVFADYMMHLFAYAIRLDVHFTSSNPVFVLCGGSYQLIAGSFTEFLGLYRRDSPVLYMGNEEPGE
ncbi:SMI1/KNR4 family protein [Hymenobacter metallicola]|uniref:SMI1/KNR4 family protein n=1 Tax=Hymenobacter metallicola TaxID=2563114 RepID=A0A4Z0PVP8_9BACT|nr:SMI1/KNR4 family protein [Hymenobacter metallicola]TGE20923.1 SMI1/KNR4 family protein [Hymenobacter metallicola]